MCRTAVDERLTVRISIRSICVISVSKRESVKKIVRVSCYS